MSKIDDDRFSLHSLDDEGEFGEESTRQDWMQFGQEVYEGTRTVVAALVVNVRLKPRLPLITEGDIHARAK